MLNAPDDEIIARARKGDRTAITAIYEQTYPAIYRYLYYRLDCQEAAEDLSSEVYVRMISSLDTFCPQEVPFPALLFQIARNLTIDYYRRMQHRNHLPLEENVINVTQDLTRSLDGRLNSVVLRQALNRISENQRDVLVLRFIAGMPIGEVAQMIRKSEDAVKGLQRRGLLALRSLLIEQENHHA